MLEFRMAFIKMVNMMYINWNNMEWLICLRLTQSEVLPIPQAVIVAKQKTQ